MNKIVLTLSFIGAWIAILAYKVLVHEEPWAIGMTQVLFLTVALVVGYIHALRFKETKETVREFFNGMDSPINLAIFRIAFFAYLFLIVDCREVVWFSTFSKDLYFAPIGMGRLLPILPINEAWASGVCFLFKLFCFLSMLGLWTRLSTILVAITGFYVIGVPNFYGNVAHNHHLFWFLVILAISRCGDVLSIDAVRNGFKRADQNDTSVPAESMNYALPLRFIWILMGLCYFFPGFWKLWTSGTAWILGDNLKYHMYYDWMSFDNWIPMVRIDQYPWLCRISAVCVIFFEVSFLFFIFVKGLRWIVALAGLLFHNLTNLLMKIDFYDLQICYVSFFDWDKIFRWCGQRLFRDDMTVLFDGSCSFCRRAVVFLRTFDIFGRIVYLDLHEPAAQAVRNSGRLSQDDLMADMHALIGSNVFKGLAAYQKIATRIPLLWPLCPFFMLEFVQRMGNNIYRNNADHRACRFVVKRSSLPIEKLSSNMVLIVTATILIIGTTIFGFMDKGSGWPLACYPTFSEIASDRFMTIDCEIINADGSKRTIPIQSLKSFTGSYRITGLMGKIFNIKDESVRNKKFLALWDVLASVDPDLKNAKTVRFYFLDNYTDPAQRHLNPIDKKMAFEFDVHR